MNAEFVIHTRWIRKTLAAAVLTAAVAASSQDTKTSAEVGAALLEPQPASDFSVLGSTASGQTLAMNLPAARTVPDAVTQTGEALAKIFDGRPTLSGGFADAKTNGRGGALFTAKLKGKDLQGWIFCSAAKTGMDKGMMSTVVYAPANAEKSDVATLFAYLPAEEKTETHKFPDGSGSVDLPPGWTTRQQSLTNGVAITGPAGQMVIMGSINSVSTPDCNLVQMRMKTYQMAMQTYNMRMQTYQQQLAMHQRYPNTMAPLLPVRPSDPDPEKEMPNIVFCRYCAGPEEVLKYYYPIMEKRGKDAGQPYTTLDKILAVTPADPNPQIPNDKAGVCYLQVTDHVGDKVTPVRVMVRIETSPIFEGKDSWLVSFNTLRAPDATFDRDLPVMYAILNSFQYNMDVINKQRGEMMDAMRKIAAENTCAMLQRGRDFNKQQDETFHRFQAQEKAREDARHDAASDYIEMIRGVRDVYDNKTGEMHSVDLYNVNGIVNGMNNATNDPGRFVQVPLRYQR